MRDILFNAVKEACQNNLIEVYGSFRTENFHYSRINHNTFSDIDGISKNFVSDSELNVKSKKISDYVFNKTGINIETHLRNKRPHGDDLEKNVPI